jgi:hypothetical protein
LSCCQLYDGFSKSEGTIEVTVSANSLTQIPFFVPKGRAIVWKVLLKALDVSFSLKLRVQEMGGAVEHDLEHEQRVAAGEYFVGERKAIDFEDRHIVMLLDNRSLPRGLRAKTISYKVTIAAPEKATAVKEQYAKEAEEFFAQAVAAKAEAVEAGAGTDRGAEVDGGASGDEGTGEAPAPAKGLVGNILSYSTSVISTAQTNAVILAQKAQENPRVSGAISFLQSRGSGVLGRFWGGGKGKAEEETQAGTEAEADGVENEATATADGEGSVATSGVVAPAAAAPVAVGAVAVAVAAEAHDDSFTDDAQAAFVMVDLNANTKAP